MPALGSMPVIFLRPRFRIKRFVRMDLQHPRNPARPNIGALAWRDPRLGGGRDWPGRRLSSLGKVDRQRVLVLLGASDFDHLLRRQLAVESPQSMIWADDEGYRLAIDNVQDMVGRSPARQDRINARRQERSTRPTTAGGPPAGKDCGKRRNGRRRVRTRCHRVDAAAEFATQMR